VKTNKHSCFFCLFGVLSANKRGKFLKKNQNATKTKTGHKIVPPLLVSPKVPLAVQLNYSGINSNNFF
jgi:hypothetical protein